MFLIYYDSQKTEQEKIIKTMHGLGYLQPLTAKALRAPEATAENNFLMNLVVSSVAQSMMEMALTRLVTAII